MKKNILKFLTLLVAIFFMVSCSKKNDTIKIVFLPNEANESLKKSRDEFAKIIQ